MTDTKVPYWLSEFRVNRKQAQFENPVSGHAHICLMSGFGQTDVSYVINQMEI